MGSLHTSLGVHLLKIGRQVQNVRGDGFCLLTSIRVALEKDYNIQYADVQLQQMILANLRHHGDDYLKWYPGTRAKLFQDMLEFFSSKNYQQNVVDILVRIAADALYIKIHIYQMSAMETQIFTPSVARPKTRNLQFLRNPQYEMMNHYNPLVMKPSDVQRPHVTQCEAAGESRQSLEEIGNCIKA